MIKKLGFSLRIIVFAAAPCLLIVSAQEPSSSKPEATEQQLEEKANREKQAFILLDQIVNDAQFLRLPENRINVQIDSADLLWDNNQARARTLFAGAGDGIVEMMRNLNESEQRRGPNPARAIAQLRQKLVLTVARHEATLAYQLLAATRAIVTPTSDGTNPRGDEDNLEQALLGRIADFDPKLALQNAEEMLDKGKFPRTLPNVLVQLRRKDKEASAKLEDKMLKRLQAANLLTSRDAGSLALGLLRPGPRASEQTAGEGQAAQDNSREQVLAQSTYVDLLGTVIDAALKSVPQVRNQRGQNNPRGRRAPGVGRPAVQSAPTQTQIEQANARGLMQGLQGLLTQIDQHLPSRAPAVRAKLTELGLGDTNQRAEMNRILRQGSADTLLTAARTAPPQMQSRLYQQAALKALEEGNADRARQIAGDYLEGRARDRVLQQVEFRRISEKTEATRLDELRATLPRLRSDNERIDLLIQLAVASKQDDPKLAIQLLDEARQLTNKRAVNYDQFEQQLKVAEAFRELEPSRSFEVLEPGIAQLNELLAAAVVLSGFEVSVFRDGELPLESRNGLSGMITRYGQALGVLARTDFDRAQALANRFQLTEPRILTRISIVRSMLGNQPTIRVPNPEIRGGDSIRAPE